MKIKNLFITLGLAVAATATIGAGLKASEKKSASARSLNYNVTISTPLNPTYETARYWFINNDGGFWNASAKFGIHVWGGTGVTDAYYLLNAYANTNGGQTFFYIDVPTAAESFQLIRFSSSASVGTNKEVWNDTGTFAFSSYKPYYLHWYHYDSGNSLSNSKADNPRPSAYLLSAVLQGYVTCSDSELNGHGAAAKLYENWISLYDGSANGNWTEVSILDYPYAAYHSNGDAYGSTQSRSESVTVYNKWVELATRAGIDPSTGKTSSLLNPMSIIGANNNSTLVIVVISALVLVSTGGFFFLRKKQENE